MLRIVTFKIDEFLLEELDKYCRRHGLSRSEALRKAVKLLIQEDKLYGRPSIETMPLNIKPRVERQVIW